MIAKAVLQGFREVSDRHSAIAVPCIEGSAEALCGQAHEAVHIIRTTQYGYGLAPFGKHVVRGEAALGEDRARHPVAGRAPCVVHFGLGLDELEGPLVGPGMCAAVQEDGLHDGVDHFVVVHRQEHGDAELLADLLGLAEDSVSSASIRA